MNIDFSSFRKIEDGDKHAVLEHPSGHHLKIAKKGLSEQLRKQLDELPTSLAKGGYAKFSQKFDPNMGSKASKPSKSSTTMPGNQAAASKAFTEPDDMGTNIPKTSLKQAMTDHQYPDVVVNSLNRKAPPYGALSSDEKQHYPPCLNPSCKSFGKSHPNCRCYGGNPEGKESHLFAEGGAVEKEYYCDTDRPHFKSCEYYSQGGKVQKFADKGEVEPNESEKNLAAAANEVQNPMPPVSSMESDQQPDSSSQPVPTPLPAPQSSSEVNPNPEMQGNESVPEPEPAPAQTQPDSDQQQSAPQERPPATPADAVMQHKDRIMNEIYPEAQAFKADLDNGHIQPETYSDLFNKKDTLGKIGTIFGLMLSGAGSGLSHQPNMLMTMMDNEIKRDLEAQQNSQTNKQNFLKINQQNVLNKAQASNLTQEANTKAYALSRMQMNLSAFHKLVSDTQKLPPGSPQRMQAEQQLALMNQGIQNENFNIADRAASAGALSAYLGGGQNGNTPNTTIMKSGLLGPEAKEVGTDIESKQVPGFSGRADHALGDSEKSELRSGAVFDSAMNDLIGWAKSHPNGAISGSPEDQRGRALAGIVQGKFREATNGGVYKSGEQDFINKLVPEDPTKAFNSFRVLPKLEAVKNEMAKQTDAKSKSYGFKGYNGISNQQQGQTKVVNGVKYKRGPNGEAVKVQ